MRINPKIAVWLFFILVSLLLIAPNPFATGFVVTQTNSNYCCVGDIIYTDNIDDLKKPQFGLVKLETNKGTKYINANGSLGIRVENVPSNNLNFGLDLKGGVRAFIQPNQSDAYTLEQTISTLQTRTNIYGLREFVFRPVYADGKGFIELSMAGGDINEMRSLLENQGKFEAKIPLYIRAKDATLKLDNEYKISLFNDSIQIGNKTYNPGDSFKLSNIDFKFEGLSRDKKVINLTSTVFQSDGIVAVYFDPQRSSVERRGDAWRWQFAVQLSGSAAKNFAQVTSNVNLAGPYLESPIDLYLDGKLINSLNIASGLRGNVATEISIEGGAENFKQAVAEKNFMQTILRSGALPTSLHIVSIESVSASLGSTFLKNALIAGLVAILGVVVVVTLRYHKPKVIFPMLFVSLSEVLIILGFAAGIGWTIDLAAIAGIIASVGTGIDAQIIIADQALRSDTTPITLRDKLKRAFFIIFGSAGTSIAAMLPLMTIGFGLLRGFAIVTIIGILIGVFITRPAYGAIIEILHPTRSVTSGGMRDVRTSIKKD